MLLHYFWDKAIEHLTSEKLLLILKIMSHVNLSILKEKDYRKLSRDTGITLQLKSFQKHAYVRTALIALIYKTRTLGVLAPCELRWLRNYDRTLWALVQNVGRPSVYVEQLAAFSHYTSEAYYHRRKISPDFSYGWNGLQKALNNIATPILMFIYQRLRKLMRSPSTSKNIYFCIYVLKSGIIL